MQGNFTPFSFFLFLAMLLIAIASSGGSHEPRDFFITFTPC